MAAKFWNHVKHDARYFAASWKVQFKAAAALRGAFVIQVVGMIINNVMLMGGWLFFFGHFGQINGWGMADFVAMQGMAMFVFALIVGASAGFMDLGRHVDSGSFDSFLTKPSSVMGQVSSSNIDISTLGDLVLGIGLIVWYILTQDTSALSLLLTGVTIASGCVVLWCFALVIPNTLAFYVFDSERVSRYTSFLFLDGMNYPTGVLKGAFRLFFLILMPSMLAGVVPIDTIRGLHWEWVALGAVVAIVWLVFSIWLFKRAVRRYESANLVGSR